MKVLLVGYGNMGKLHSKYLKMMKVDWFWYDPFVDENCPNRVPDISNLSNFSHIIIASPTSSHEKYLKDIIPRFDGKIFVEKPGVMSIDSIYLIENKKVSVGMVERFNPGFVSLYKAIKKENVLCVDFVRCSALPVSRMEVNAFIDVGIHDIDLLVQMFPDINIKKASVFRNSNTFAINLSFNDNKIARFMWSNETFHKDRKIHIRQNDYNLECNLSDQTVKKYYLSENNENIVKDLYVEKKSSILAELEYFLNTETRIDATTSHKIFLEMLKNEKELANHGV